MGVLSQQKRCKCANSSMQESKLKREHMRGPKENQPAKPTDRRAGKKRAPRSHAPWKVHRRHSHNTNAFLGPPPDPRRNACSWLPMARQKHIYGLSLRGRARITDTWEAATEVRRVGSGRGARRKCRQYRVNEAQSNRKDPQIADERYIYGTC